MLINKLRIIFILILFNIGLLRTQSISLSGEIFEYATYYVNSFDFSTGATSVQIFRYELSSNQYPVSLKVRFKTTILSPALGITNEQTIIEIETDPFLLQAPLVLDNRDLSSEATVIFDMDTPPNQVDLDGNIIEILEPTQVDAILQSVMTTGQIADGEYSFEVIILSEDDQVLASDSKTFLVQSPVSVTLESPGGALSDTLDNMVYTTFPIFQWFSQPCGGCNTFIRVAQFNSQIHSSLEEAIEDQRVLPFDQSEYWYPIDNLNSYQYPPSDAYPLEEGNIYCWQIMMTVPTTSGEEQMPSSISAFMINESGGNSNNSSNMNTLLLALEQVLGQNQYDALFGSGNELQDFFPTGQIEINGVGVDESSLNYLFNQINSDTYQIQSIIVE
ncbi:MAG: hypothetical protein CMG55_05395 [Candidatus Marinimicrobia bacterium]|nr:hypothetical protein [Candidatus Neomarinimicrobiota bacterium]